jgi:hypothetical protein
VDDIFIPMAVALVTTALAYLALVVALASMGDWSLRRRTGRR